MEIISVIVIIVGAVFLLGWLQKVLGVTMTSKTMRQQSINISNQDVEDLKLLSVASPQLVNDAIKECERKFYRKTADNIMTEVNRIAKIRGVSLEKILCDFRNSDKYLKNLEILLEDNGYKEFVENQKKY